MDDGCALEGCLLPTLTDHYGIIVQMMIVLCLVLRRADPSSFSRTLPAVKNEPSNLAAA